MVEAVTVSGRPYSHYDYVSGEMRWRGRCRFNERPGRPGMFRVDEFRSERVLDWVRTIFSRLDWVLRN